MHMITQVSNLFAYPHNRSHFNVIANNAINSWLTIVSYIGIAYAVSYNKRKDFLLTIRKDINLMIQMFANLILISWFRSFAHTYFELKQNEKCAMMIARINVSMVFFLNIIFC